MDGVLRSFQTFMDGGGDTTLMVWGLTLTACAPLQTLVHELGHASIGLARTKGLVRVHVGREPGVLRGRIGRLVLTFDPRPSTGPRNGFAQTFGHLSRGERLAHTAAGPAVQLVLSSALLATGRPLVQAVGGYGVAMALYNLVPRVRRGQPSDGAVLRATLQQRPWRSRTAADELLEQARLVYLDRGRHMTEPRRRVLAHGLTQPELVRAAYAGWCWGEVTADFWARVAALDALHGATRSGAVEPELSAVAARELASAPQPAGRFVDLAFSAVRLPGVDEAAQRNAFLYGIAARDIERIRA